jgi:hypothetical protein
MPLLHPWWLAQRRHPLSHALHCPKEKMLGALLQRRLSEAREAPLAIGMLGECTPCRSPSSRLRAL